MVRADAPTVVEEAPTYGDVLEAILSHVPVLDLLPASHVCKGWNAAAFTSLRHGNRPKPWFIVHTQSPRPPPCAASTHAYDPSSGEWIELNRPPIECFSSLRSSNSNLLYMLSASKFSFSADAFHLNWQHVDAPKTWRTDPIVALIGRRVVVAGGAGDFEEDPLSVEIYDLESKSWNAGESMPAILGSSSSSNWLSTATDGRILFVIEKRSGVTHSFDPETKTWSRLPDLHPDPSIFYSAIVFSDDRLILIGLIGTVDSIRSLKIWEVNCETFLCKEIGEMPEQLLKQLESRSFQMPSIGLCAAGKLMYLHNPSLPEEVFVCEFVNGGCRWDSEPTSLPGDQYRLSRFAFTCSKVGVDDVYKLLRSGYRRLPPSRRAC